MEKANVVLVVLNRAALARSVHSLNFDAVHLVAIIVEGVNGQDVNIGGRSIPLFSFAYVHRFTDADKNFLWLISGNVVNFGDLWKFKKFLMNSGVPEDNIVNFEMMISDEWIANLRYVEERGADFFATGISYTEVGLDLRYIPHRFGRGVNLAGSNQDLRQGYLTAKYVFEHVAPGTIKFVLIGLTPYSLRYSNAESFSVCTRNLQYMLALDLPAETRHDKLLDILVSDAVKESFKSITAAQADLNFNRTKTALNAELPAKTPIDWEAELTNVIKKMRPQVVEKNFRILEDYIKLCRQHGAKPVGVVFPFAPIIRKKFDENLLTSFRLAIRRLQENYDFPCADLFDLKLGYDCFYNTAHLNLRGAAVASTLLGWNLHAKNLLPKEAFCDMNYDYFYLLSNLLPKDNYNALMADVFKLSAQMIRCKDKIKVGFVTYDASMWCGDELYKFFARDEKFEPTVFLCLRTDQGDNETVKQDFLHGVEQFKSRGINVFGLTDINAVVPAQDVLIFLTPYLNVLPNAFQLSKLNARTLTAYIPYSFTISQWYDHLSLMFYSITWKNFTESTVSLNLFEQKYKIGARRNIFSGYPKMDVFFKDDVDFKFDWKTARPDAKKIIWAPHWSIADAVKYATFQWNYQFMYEFARAHPEISWVVKPHPNLLFSAVEMGVFPSAEAFEAYMKAWDDLPNAQVYTGAYYQALFATSDGMIHDSGSFIAEYQYVDKPMIYLTRETQKFNELGEKILSASYRVDGRDLQGIAALMQKVFIEGNDPLKDARRKVFDEYLNYYKYNGMTASEFIFKNIAADLNCVRSEKIFGGDIVSNPLVSVIVPVYKAERYIRQCVDSILAQTFQDFEIILVDDASPDDSVALCQKLYGDNDKVKILRHEKNLCQGAARNTGMKHAVGKYIYFVDSDDFILPDTLERFYTIAEKTDADIVHATGWYALYQDEPAPVRQEDLEPGGDDYTREGFLSEDLLYRLDEHWTKYRTYSMVWMCFCRREFLQENGIEFLPIVTEDDIFHFALLFCARRYYVLPATLYIYRRHKNSVMFTRNAEHLAKCIPSVARGAAYIKSFLDRVPRFEHYEQWCAKIINAYISRFVSAQTLGYYANLALSPETAAAADGALEKLFGENAPFVSNLFNGYHIFFCQGKILEQQVQSLRAEIQRLKGDHPDAIVDALKSADRRILLLGTPTHGDLGDQAIVAGELRILKDYFPDRAVIEVSYDYLTGGLDFAKYVRRDDLIFMHGSGNFGNLWLNEEQLRRALIDAFPDNKIVIFPQSICFTDDDAGRRELAISQRVYNAHDDLHLMTRDEVSFEFAQKFFPRVNNYLMPDAATVLYGITDDEDVAREGVLFVLRGDKEKSRDDAKIQILQESFADANIPFEVIDTVISETVTAGTRDEKIRAALLKIRQSKLVVTDRFHGVVFAFVTRTPVLAFKSFDTKISSGVKWFENFPSVFYAEESDWDAIETFINLAFDDAAVFAELNPDVKIDSKALFFNALDQIVGANTLQMSQAAKKFQ